MIDCNILLQQRQVCSRFNSFHINSMSVIYYACRNSKCLLPYQEIK